MSGFKMDLPSSVLFIIDRMNSCGYSAHVVGGSVRDSFIGRELGDFDITTNARPDETKSVFADYKTVDTGIKHGTVTLIIDDTPYEITTYRVDGEYGDNRHPDSVSFTASLEEDLMRRDFTVNAMAYDPQGGLVDPFSGCEDAQNKLIRAVGDPYLRFSEDALRILRALRFASVLGFEVEQRTKEAAISLSQNLASISKERIYAELKKLISGDSALAVIAEYYPVIAVALGGFEIRRTPDPVLFERADYLTRLAALIHMNSDAPTDSAECLLASLKTDKLTRTYIKSAYAAYDGASFGDAVSVLHSLAEYGKEATAAALELGILEGVFGDSEAGSFDLALSSGKPYTVRDLDLCGDDLMALGIRGESIGHTLKLLLSEVIDGRVENSRRALTEYASGLV